MSTYFGNLSTYFGNLSTYFGNRQSNSEICQTNSEIVQPFSEIIQTNSEICQQFSEIVQTISEIIQPFSEIVQTISEISQTVFWIVFRLIFIWNMVDHLNKPKRELSSFVKWLYLTLASNFFIFLWWIITKDIWKIKDFTIYSTNVIKHLDARLRLATINSH